jgi:hypothetical protein
MSLGLVESIVTVTMDPDFHQQNALFSGVIVRGVWKKK